MDVLRLDFDYATLDGMLEDAFVDPEKPLPANPEGSAKLNALLTEIAQGSGPQAGTSLPDITQQISGRPYECVPNAAGVTSMRFEFNDLKTAYLYMEQNNADVVWPIGLDGQFRLSSKGEGVRGGWKDEQNLIVNLFDIGLVTLEMQFIEDQLTITVPAEGLVIKCQLQNP